MDTMDGVVAELQKLAALLQEAIEMADEAEHQLREKRTQEALELSPAELHMLYPEAVDERGAVRTRHPEPPHVIPYEFWLATGDADLTRRLGRALREGRELAQQAVVRQEELEDQR